MTGNQSNIHFPGLNALRFIAAMGVLVFHLEYKKQLLGFEFHFIKTLTLIGDQSVTLFFVLSGFLITYLLLAEKENTGTIAIKKFYARRILRIWPLYYLILIFGFFVLPHIGIFQIPTTALINTSDIFQLALFFLFFANIGFIAYENMAYIDQTWSIAVEEQFYLIWPFIIKYSKKILPALIFIIVALGALRTVLALLFYVDEVYKYSYWFISITRIDAMAIGGLFAYLLFLKYKQTLTVLYNKYVQVTAVALLLFLLLHGYVFIYGHHQIYSVLFGIIIINAAANTKSLLGKKIKVVDYFGKISYGIYMYHNIMIVLSLKLCSMYLGHTSTLFFVISLITSILLTLLISHLSYRYFEQFFLNLKTRFTVIKSND